MERTAQMSERGIEREGGRKKTQETSQTSNDRFKYFPVVNAGITCYSNYMLWATVAVFVCCIVT